MIINSKLAQKQEKRDLYTQIGIHPKKWPVASTPKSNLTNRCLAWWTDQLTVQWTEGCNGGKKKTGQIFEVVKTQKDDIRFI